MRHRYGFNGMEKDDEVKGSGNSLDFGARIYDSRLGRYTTLDAKSTLAPGITPYRFGFNSPIMFFDPDGNYEADGKLSKQQKKDAKREAKAEYGKEWKNHIGDVEQAKVKENIEKIHEIVSNARNVIESDDKVKAAFEATTGVKVGDSNYKLLFEQGGGPTIDLAFTEGSAATDPSGTGTALNMKYGTAYAVFSLLHEYVHYSHIKGFGGISGDYTPGGMAAFTVGGVTYDKNQQQKIMGEARNALSKGQRKFDKAYSDDFGNPIIDAGYLFEMIGFGNILHRPEVAKDKTTLNKLTQKYLPHMGVLHRNPIRY